MQGGEAVLSVSQMWQLGVQIIHVGVIDQALFRKPPIPLFAKRACVLYLQRWSKQNES